MSDSPQLRPLDPGETFFHVSDQVSCMNFAVLAERDGALTPERIQAALDTLQRAHPLLQVGVVRSDAQHLGFVQRPDVRIGLRCQPLDAGAWQQGITDWLQEPFAEGEAPLMRCLYLEFPDGRSVLALCFHHSIADGRSGMDLLQSLLRLLAAGALPEAAHQPLPPMTERVPPAFRWAEQAEAAKALKSAVVGDYRRHGAPTPLPWLDHAAGTSSPQLHRLQFDADCTRGLMARARAENTSLHGALCAAQLLAVSQQQPDLPTQVLMLGSPVDMRAHLAPPPPVSPTGLFVAIVSSNHRIDPDTSVWALAREIRDQMQRQLARGEAHLFYALYGLDGTPSNIEQTAALKQKILASLPHTMVSNIGRVAPVSDDPLLRNLSFALFPMPYQSLFTAASTFNDQLTLNIGFNANRLGSHADRLIDALRLNLLNAATA